MVQLYMITRWLAGRPYTRDTVLRHTVLALLGLGYSCGIVACAPTLVGPTVPSGYLVSMDVSAPIIWLGASIAGGLQPLPTVSEVSVRVQDKQGQPVDGVPVTFEVAPDWAQYASVSPSQSTTRGGVARTFFTARLTGVVYITARVENTTAQTRVTVQHFGGPPPSSEAN